MRTIEEIKDAIAADFMNREEIAKTYGFAPGDDFTKHFSKISILNVLFYIFACSTWVLEKLHEDYKAEIEEKIDAIIPHRLKWYRDKTLQFMKGHELIEDTDRYDTSEMTEDDIEAARPIAAAVAVESSDASLLTIKVKAKEEYQEETGVLDTKTREQLEYYLQEIRDAGVPINLVNDPGDEFSCEVDIYYNPMLLPETVQENCRAAIENYMQHELGFNGEYTNMGLIDKLQELEGVRIAELVEARYKPKSAIVAKPINARCVPEAGWFRPIEGGIVLNMHIHE